MTVTGNTAVNVALTRRLTTTARAITA